MRATPSTRAGAVAGRGALLQGAKLQGARLKGTDLPAPTMLLLADWGDLPDDLTLELMRYDASCHPEPERFDEWALGAGPCPYDNTKFERSAEFTECRELWNPGPAMRTIELVMWLLRSQCDLD